MTITIERVRELLLTATPKSMHIRDALPAAQSEQVLQSSVHEIAALAISEHERAEKAEAELRALRDQVAALQADAERLDALIRGDVGLGTDARGFDIVWRKEPRMNVTIGNRSGHRAVIDALMAWETK